MGPLQINSTQLNRRILYLILSLGIITFFTSLLGGIKYSIIAHWFKNDIPLSLEDTQLMMQNFAVNLSQRVPVLVIWIPLFICIINLYRMEDKSFKSTSIFAGSALAILILSAILFTLWHFSILDFSYIMLFGNLEPDFFLLLIANILELLIWLRMRPYLEISPYLKKKQKRIVNFGIILLIIAVGASLLLKLVFIGDELGIMGFSPSIYYTYYSWVFGVCAGLEILKAILYLTGGLFVGIYKEKRVKLKKGFTITNTK